MNVVVKYCAASFLTLLVIFQVVNGVCYCKRDCREGSGCCCNSPCCFRLNRIIFAFINVILALSMLTMTGIAYG